MRLRIGRSGFRTISKRHRERHVIRMRKHLCDVCVPAESGETIGLHPKHAGITGDSRRKEWRWRSVMFHWPDSDAQAYTRQHLGVQHRLGICGQRSWGTTNVDNSTALGRQFTTVPRMVITWGLRSTAVVWLLMVAVMALPTVAGCAASVGETAEVSAAHGSATGPPSAASTSDPLADHPSEASSVAPGVPAPGAT